MIICGLFYLNACSDIAALNVILFGEAGAGKSSVVNMLNGTQKADISSDATSACFESRPYLRTISDKTFRVFDTAGLNDKSEMVSAEVTIRALHELIRKLSDGVSLLVYVMRASRIMEIADKNYKLFCETFCQRQVPIVVVLTGLENEDDMDAWWERNKDIFKAYGMSFKGFACITATTGKRRGDTYVFGDEYERSKKKVEKLILESASKTPWRMSRTAWLIAVGRNIINKVYNTLKWKKEEEELENILKSDNPT